ncbi:MAG: nuclear transport factor 2 family protein [Panacagrimonas sp.]
MWRVLALCASLALPWAAPAASPTETLDVFHQALRENQSDTVLVVLAVDAVIYEQGFAETSRDEWVRNQLGPAIAFARDSERRVLRRASGESGDMAWVISSTQTKIKVVDRPLILEGAETAILRREGGGWKIVHLHWSAHDAEPTP